MDIFPHNHQPGDGYDYDGCPACVDHNLQLDDLCATLFRTAHNYDHHSPSARLDGIDNLRTILRHYLATGNVLAAARPDNPGHGVGQSRHSLRYAT